MFSAEFERRHRCRDSPSAASAASTRVHRCGGELTGQSRIAERVRPLAIETGSVSSNMQPRAQSIAGLWRRPHDHRPRQRNMSDSDERIRNDVGLERRPAADRRCARRRSRRTADRCASRRSGDGSTTEVVEANASRFSTRSMRTVTRSPGIAPATSKICPSCRAIIRPPAAGFSTSTLTSLPGDQHVSRMSAREGQRVAQEAIEGRRTRTRELGRWHAGLERSQFRVRVTASRAVSSALGFGLSRMRSRLVVQRSQRVDNRRACIASGAVRIRQQADRVVESPPSSARRTPGFCRIRARSDQASRRRARYVWPAEASSARAPRGLPPSPARHTNRPSPCIEQIENVGLTEFDANRSAAAGPWRSSDRSTDRCPGMPPSTERR